MSNTYYISSRAQAGGNGLSAATPLLSWHDISEILPGDTLLFERGSFFRDVLEMPNGEEGAPISCGAYGEGEKPVFAGSISLMDAGKWAEIRENIWRYEDDMPTEPGNIIFENDVCGVLAWEEDELIRQDRWHYTGIGGDNGVVVKAGERLLLYSCGNPAKVHTMIEAALYGKRHMVSGQKHVRFEDIAFINSCVHGYGEMNAEDIAFRRCEFRMIGGKVWSKELKIRFGNCLENWDTARDILVEECLFDGVYDSCVTHQGPGEKCGLSVNVVYRNNTFRNYGMAAYEARDKVGLGVVFENNVCIGAGEGFALQDETPPRRSEIWPQPMGHHLFIWRMPHGTENGSIIVRNNVFGSSPYGAAVYSIIEPEAEAQFTFEGNRYEKEEGLLIRWGGKNYDAGDELPLE